MSGLRPTHNTRLVQKIKRGPKAPFFKLEASAQTENDDPQPQVVLACGFLMTNCAPLTDS